MLASLSRLRMTGTTTLLNHSSADLTIQVDAHNIVRRPTDSVQDAPPRQDARPEKNIFVEYSRHSGQTKPRSTVVPMTPVIHATELRSFFDHP